MKTKILTIAGLASVTAVLVSLGGGLLRATEQEKKTHLQIGVYDSRAIAIACINSSYSPNLIPKLFEIVHKAEAEGDTKTAQRARETAEFMQKKRHLQGFGTLPVHDLIEPVKDKLPKLAADCQVDVIVSKWEFDYLAPDARVKDITDELVALYKPTERAMNSIRHLKQIASLTEKEILEHEH